MNRIEETEPAIIPRSESKAINVVLIGPQPINFRQELIESRIRQKICLWKKKYSIEINSDQLEELVTELGKKEEEL